MRKLLFVSIAQCALAASAFGQAAMPTRDIPPPFAPTSVWNIGVGSGAQWGSPSDADVQQLRNLTGAVNAAAYGMPIYSGGSGDPFVMVMDADPGNVAIPPQSIHVPIGAKPAEGTDRHMAFYDATQPGWLWSYFGCTFNNGSDVTSGIACQLGGKWDTTGDGVANGLAPGSDYNFAVGTITDHDLAQGVIRHAVRFALSTDALKSPGPTWTDSIPWPNTHEDYYGPSQYTGNIVAGVTIGIPADVNLNSLGLSQGGMMLAQALQNYGAIWRDSCGSRTICFYSTPESDGNSLIQGMRADLAKIVPLLTIMRNQGPNSVNGGGASILTAQGPFTATNPASNAAPDLSSQQAPIDAQIGALQDCLNGSNSTTCGAAPSGPLATTTVASTDQRNVVTETPVAVSQEPTQTASNGLSPDESAMAQETAAQQRQIADAAVTKLEAKGRATIGLTSQGEATVLGRPVTPVSTSLPTETQAQPAAAVPTTTLLPSLPANVTSPTLQQDWARLQADFQAVVTDLATMDKPQTPATVSAQPTPLTTATPVRNSRGKDGEPDADADDQ